MHIKTNTKKSRKVCLNVRAFTFYTFKKNEVWISLTDTIGQKHQIIILETFVTWTNNRPFDREKKKQRETPDGTTADGFFFQQNGEIWQNSLPDFPCFDIRALQLSREPVWYSSNVVLSLLCFSVHSDFNELFPPTPPSEKITTWQ